MSKLKRTDPSEVPTYCRICEAACGLLAEKDQLGGVVRLKPDKDHPVSRGFACAKGTRFAESNGHADRLTVPEARGADGRLERTSWANAVGTVGDKIAETVKKHGPHSVGLYFGNPLAFNAFGALALARFMQGLGSRNVYSAGSQDCNNKFAGGEIIHGSPIIHPIPDFERAELAVIFGSNPAFSQASFVHLEGGSGLFDRITKAGTEVVWVDPRKTESAKRWGSHLAIRPGTDAFLLLALVNAFRDRYRKDSAMTGLDRILEYADGWTFEGASAMTGLPAERISELAARIRKSRATAFHMSVGVNQSGFGTFNYVLLQALIYLTGNFDREGGSVFHPNAILLGKLAKRFHFGTRTRHSRIGGYPSVLDTMPGGILADEILTPGDGQIRVLLVVAGDPMRTFPDTGRLREAFDTLEQLVCVDIFRSATAEAADVVLPGTTWLERFDVATTTVAFQQSPILQYAGAVCEPPGEARHDAAILSDIAKRVGGKLSRRMLPIRLAMRLTDEGKSGTAVNLFAKSTLFLGSKAPYGFRTATPKPGSYLGRGPLHRDRKVHFWDDVLAGEFDRLAAEKHRQPAEPGGFLLMGRRRRLGHNGWLRGALRDGSPEACAWLHPDDAAGLGWREGDPIRIENETGGLTVDAIVTDEVLRGTVVLPHGIAEADFNSLVPTGEATIDPLSGMHRMTGIPVRVTVPVVEKT